MQAREAATLAAPSSMATQELCLERGVFLRPLGRSEIVPNYGPARIAACTSALERP